MLEEAAHLTSYFRNKPYCFFQVRILKDISESLNFTYKIRPPTDGNKWGLIFPNGSATGLVKDVKVFLNTIFCQCGSCLFVTKEILYSITVGSRQRSYAKPPILKPNNCC